MRSQIAPSSACPNSLPALPAAPMQHCTMVTSRPAATLLLLLVVVLKCSADGQTSEIVQGGPAQPRLRRLPHFTRGPSWRARLCHSTRNRMPMQCFKRHSTLAALLALARVSVSPLSLLETLNRAHNLQAAAPAQSVLAWGHWDITCVWLCLTKSQCCTACTPSYYPPSAALLVT